MHPDAPTTKRDLNEMAEAIVRDIRDEMNERFDGMGEEIADVKDKLVQHEALLIIIAHKLDIPEADIDRALTPPPRP